MGVTRVLVLDSYDSFVYNLVPYLGELGAEPVVYRNDDETVPLAESIEPGEPAAGVARSAPNVLRDEYWEIYRALVR